MEHGTPLKKHSNSTNQGDRLALDTYTDTAKHMPQEPDPNLTDKILEYLREVCPGNAGGLIETLLGAAHNPSGNGGGGHDDIVRVLNSISLCFVETLDPPAKPKTKSILFVSTPKHPIPEDDMETDIRPDWYAYMTTYEVLTASVRGNVAPPPGSYYSIIGIGEQVSGGSNAVGKIMHYLRILSTYRYDLRTVYGFQYNHLTHEGRHWSFNACGWAYSDSLESDPEPTPNAEEAQGDPLLPWVQHVLFLYSSDYSRIGHIARGDHVGVNIWTVDGKSYIVVPFHASYGPGRMSIVFLILMNIKANHIVGIFKRQWRDKAGRFVEGSLMRRVQELHWYPCCPDVASFGPIGTYEISQCGYDVARVLSFLDMRTWGDPLTSCPNSTELLMTAYDAVLAHWLVYKKRGILHRDVSSNNILYKPQHYFTSQELEERKRRRQPFRKPIKEVLEGVEDEWCALLTDFDQAVIYDEWHGHGDQKRLERMGTPMFIAIEQSSEVATKIPTRTLKDLKKLSDALADAQVRDSARFMLAFPCPQENEIFNTNWTAVLAGENDRQSCLTDDDDEFLDPMQEHQAYHDVESFFWVFLWTFARAQPEDSDSAQTKDYTKFCDTMLHHEIGGKDDRLTYLFRLQDHISEILHPKLQRFSQLFINMAEYLSIPWGRYKTLKLPDDHAHLAMLRLLLGAILKEDKDEKEPTRIANKIRHYKSAFPTKEVRLNSKSKSRSRSIPFTQAANLGTIPEVENLQPPESTLAGKEITSQTISVGATEPVAACDPNASEKEKILLPLPPVPYTFLRRVAVFKHGKTSAPRDNNPAKPVNATRPTGNSAGSSVNDENPFIDGDIQPVGNKRQTRPADQSNQGRRLLKRSKSTD